MSGLLPDQESLSAPLTGARTVPWPRTAALMLVCVGGNSRDAGPSPVGPSHVLRGQEYAGGPARSLTLPQHSRQPGSAPSDTQEE